VTVQDRMSVSVGSPCLTNSRATTIRARPERIQALDMTKGVLVVCMVIYHSFNYSTDYTLGFKLLPFLPPSFILIAGFLVAKKSAQQNNAPDVHSLLRAVLRGLRLLAIFTLLNVATQLVGKSGFNGEPEGIGYFFDHWFEVYIPGEGRFATFSILLPISYLLMLAPALVLLDRWNLFLVPTLTVVLIVISEAWSQSGESPANLILLCAGMLGVILGRIPLDYLFKMARYWFIAAVAYAGDIFLGQLAGQTVPVHLLGACLALALIFSVCVFVGEKGLPQRRLVTLGRYSLLAYILQIAVLQVLARLFGRVEPFTVAFFLQMLGVLLLMIIVAESLGWARRKSTWVDASYRMIFA
jgi:peptidoglycan/LPS O-acetylase OafA/YrhL